MPRISEHEKIAQAIATIAHRHNIREAEGGRVNLPYTEVAAELRTDPDRLRNILLTAGNLVWGRLPLGWNFSVSAVGGDDTITVYRQRY